MAQVSDEYIEKFKAASQEKRRLMIDELYLIYQEDIRQQAQEALKRMRELMNTND